MVTIQYGKHKNKNQIHSQLEKMSQNDEEEILLRAKSGTSMDFANATPDLDSQQVITNAQLESGGYLKIDEMENGPILKTMLKISIPAMIGVGLLQICYLMASSLTAQFLGDEKYTATSNVAPTESTFSQNPLIALSTGCSILISLSIGEKRPNEIAKIHGQYIIMALCMWVAIPAIFGPWFKTYLKLVGTNDQLIDYAYNYGIIYICLGAVQDSMTSALLPMFICMNQPITPFICYLLSSLWNITNMFIFIKLLHFDIEAIALCFTLPNIMCGLILAYKCFFDNKISMLSWKSMKPNKEYLKRITMNGLAIYADVLPMQLRSLFSPMIIKTFSQSINDTVKFQLIYGIVNNLQMFCQMPLVGLCSGAQPILGCAMGAKNMRRTYRVMKTAFLLVMSVGLVLIGLIIGLAGLLVRLFTKTEEYYPDATFLCRLTCSGTFFSVGLQIVTVILQQEKREKTAFMIQAIKSVLIIILMFVLPAVTHQVKSMFYASLIGDLIGGVVAIVFWVLLYKKYKID